MLWTSYDWLNKFYNFDMAVVIIGSGCGLRIEGHCKNQSCKTKLSLYKRVHKPLLLLQSFKTVVCT